MRVYSADIVINLILMLAFPSRTALLCKRSFSGVLSLGSHLRTAFLPSDWFRMAHLPLFAYQECSSDNSLDVSKSQVTLIDQLHEILIKRSFIEMHRTELQDAATKSSASVFKLSYLGGLLHVLFILPFVLNPVLPLPAPENEPLRNPRNS